MNTATITAPSTCPTHSSAGWAARPAAGPDTVACLRRVDRGGTHWISRPQGRRIVCDSGVLWLCFDGDDREIQLQAGQSHACDRQARLSVYALEAGSFHVV